MKNATLLFTLFSLFATYGYCQAAGAYAGAAAAASGSTAGSASALGHSLNNAVSGTASGVANASSSKASGNARAVSSTTTYIAKPSAGTTETGTLAAELTQRIDSKNAKIGDEVSARTIANAQLANGTKLPKGTRLVGKVTEAQARSDAQHDGHLAFAFDRALLRDGTEIPIHATLQSIAAPFAVFGMEPASQEDVALDEPVGAAAGARASGGLLGGAVGRTGGLVGGATSTAFSAPAHVTNTAGTTVHGTTALATDTGISRATVTNLPGIRATSSGTSSTILDAHGRNVDLNSGTQLTFAVAAQ